MESGTIVAVYNECLFTSSGGGACIRWTDPAEKSVTLERAERSGGVTFDLREVFRAALGEGGEPTKEGALEYDPRISKNMEYGATDTYGNAVTATLAMIRRGELEGNDLLDLPYMVQSQRPRREGHLYIPQFEGFPVGISVRQTRNGGGCFVPKTYCVDVSVEYETLACVEINVSEVVRPTYCVAINVSEI